MPNCQCSNTRKLFKINWSDDIPLVGCIAFGVIDRGTNILQIRPSSTCPLSCIFCSTDAGPKSKWRQTEYFVELDYLIHVVRELVAFKGGRHIEAHIDTVGDPTTYPHLIDLVCKLADIPGIEVISMQTHGTLLNERMIDELADAGLSRINLSIDALNEDLARKIAGADFYDINHITSIAEYISQSKIDLLIAPVWIPGINNSEIPKIVEFAKKIGAGKKWPPLGIQKYEYHKFGRKPPGVKPISWYKFYKTLRVWEKELNVKLILKPEDFNIIKLPMLPRPFKRFEKVKVTVVGPGWLKGEKIATAKGRVITLVDADDIPIGVKVYARILRTKHNIYIARVE